MDVGGLVLYQIGHKSFITGIKHFIFDFGIHLYGVFGDKRNEFDLENNKKVLCDHFTCK